MLVSQLKPLVVKHAQEGHARLDVYVTDYNIRPSALQSGRRSQNSTISLNDQLVAMDAAPQDFIDVATTIDYDVAVEWVNLSLQVSSAGGNEAVAAE